MKEHVGYVGYHLVVNNSVVNVINKNQDGLLVFVNVHVQYHVVHIVAIFKRRKKKKMPRIKRVCSIFRKKGILRNSINLSNNGKDSMILR